MILIFTIFMLSIMLLFLVLRDKNDIFSPKTLLPIIYILKIVPFLLSLALNGVPDSINNTIITEYLRQSDIVVKYIILQTFSFLCMMIVVHKVCRRADRELIIKKQVVHRSRKVNLKRWSYIFLFFGFTAISLNIIDIGGLIYFLNNLQYRTILLRDQDIYVWVSNLIVFAPILYIYSKRYDDNKNVSLLFFVGTVIVGLLYGMGARKNLIVLLIQIVFIYHYFVKPVSINKLINIKNLLVVFCILIIFTLLPLLRVEGTFDLFISDPLSFFAIAASGITDIFVASSYVPFFITIVGYFANNSMWLGSSFLGLFTAFIPSSLFRFKPPVDDGMYLYSICLGRNDIFPIMATNSLNLSSYPLETFGSMFANFGSIGVILGMMILGYIISSIYNKISCKKYSLFWLLIYVEVVFNFQLSTLRIVQFVSTAAITFLVIFIVENINIKGVS